MTQSNSSAFKPARKSYFIRLIGAGFFYAMAVAIEEQEGLNPFHIFAGITLLFAIYSRLKDLNYPRVLTFLGFFPGINVVVAFLLAQRLPRNEIDLPGPKNAHDLKSMLNHYIPPEVMEKAFKNPQTQSQPNTKPTPQKPWVDPNDRYARATAPKKTTLPEKKTYNTAAQPTYKKTEAVKRGGLSANAPTVQRSRRD